MSDLLTDHEYVANSVARRFYWQGVEHEDLHQEAMIALYRATQTWNKRGEFYGFARVVVRNHLIDCVKRARRPPIVEIHDDSVATRSLEAEVEIREQLRNAVALWKTLTWRERETLRRSVNGETNADTAASLGMTVAAVKWQVWNARRQLREAA